MDSLLTFTPTSPTCISPPSLRRDPHLLGWFRFLCQQRPPLRNATRELNLILLRRLLRDLADDGHPLPPDLIRREDFPFRDHYLPRPLQIGRASCRERV